MKPVPYTDIQKQFVIDNCSEYSRKELTALFNIQFNEARTPKAIGHLVSSLGLRCNPRTHGCFSKEHKEFMYKYGTNVSRAELTNMLNAEFHTNFPLNTVRSWCSSQKIPSPNGNGRFTSITSPRWQKGLSKEEFKSHYTKDSLEALTSHMLESNKYHVMGDIIVRHGKKYIYVNENYGQPIDSRIKLYSRYVWEQVHGPIPENFLIIHLDGDYMNCDIDNLVIIPDKYRALLRWNRWWKSPVEIKSVALKWCELYYALKECELK